jgi:hypothetical protein
VLENFRDLIGRVLQSIAEKAMATNPGADLWRTTPIADRIAREIARVGAIY